jgi:alkanesulfonate monooxygenase SsuD/methylene tetrahydromethanopterin reductase-like flavin-dependent oxidoreductase (luciferase family)
MQIGVDSFGAVISDPATGLTVNAPQRMDNLLDEIVLADQIGLDIFGIGEHHRSEFVDSAPPVILAAAATRTKNILSGVRSHLHRDRKGARLAPGNSGGI